MEKKIVVLLIGAKPIPNSNFSGGIIKRSLGILDFAKEHQISIKCIDTTVAPDKLNSYSWRIKETFRVLKQINEVAKKHEIGKLIIFGPLPNYWLNMFQKFVYSLSIKRKKNGIYYLVTGGHLTEIKNPSWLAKKVNSLLLHRYSKIAVQGLPYEVSLTRFGIEKDRIFIFRNWFEESNLPENPLKSSETILKFIFVGWFIKTKGVEELLHSVKNLSKKYNFEMWLVGGGQEENMINQFIKQNKLERFLFNFGWKSKSELYPLLLKANVFVLPSYTEGFPNSIVEALSFNLPIIATNVGAISDSVINEYNGYLISPKKQTDVESTMMNYLANPDLIKQHSLNSSILFKKNHIKHNNLTILFDNLGIQTSLKKEKAND